MQDTVKEDNSMLLVFTQNKEMRKFKLAHEIWGLMLVHVWSNMAPNCISEDCPHLCWKKCNKQM